MPSTTCTLLNAVQTLPRPRNDAEAAAHDEVRQLAARYVSTVEYWQQALLEAEQVHLRADDMVSSTVGTWDEVLAELAQVNRQFPGGRQRISF